MSPAVRGVRPLESQGEMAKKAKAEDERLTKRRRRGEGLVLSGVVFTCGAILMALEIVGSRILAPEFGNSIFVWGSLISIVLAALTVGYYLGGRLADRRPRPAVLAGVIAVAGVLIFVLPFLYPALNRGVAGSDLGPRLGPLLASLVLFLLPSICLGAVSPFAVRLRAQEVASVGTTAGLLYAVSTAGSIAGTLGTAFFLIALLRVSSIVHGLGLALVVLALLLLAWDGRRGGAALLLGLALGLGLLLLWRGRSMPEAGILLDRDTFYHHLLVSEAQGSRYLDFDNLRQSAMTVADPLDLRLAYTRTMALAVAFRPAARRVLFIGVGGGSIPKRLRHDFPDTTIDAVDIDPVVLDVAQRFFGVPRDGRLRLYAEDGRLFLQKGGEAYDVVFLDAYNSDTIPFHLTTLEFYQELQQRLAPDGIVVSNIIGALVGPRSRLFHAMARTMRAAFRQIYILPVGASAATGGVTNLIVVATPDARRLSRDEIVRRALGLQGRLVPLAEAQEAAGRLYEGPLDFSNVPLLTDDFAPVDLLLHL